MSTSNPYLIVPTRIEGMHLGSPLQVTSPLADFSKLPYNNGTQDINYSQPFVGNGVVREPFGDHNLILRGGVHLHFIIPHYVGSTIPHNAGLSNAGQLPAAPNKWLISKSKGGTISEQWIIESDYVHQEDYAPSDSSCIIPFHKKGEKPYRYMGRTTKLSATRTTGDTFKSLGGKPLTITGYGDVNFSSFYPNCHGVFGFYDKKGSDDGSTYQVLGWNTDAEDDLLGNAITELMAQNTSFTAVELNAKVEALFHVNLGLTKDDSVPSNLRTLFYGEYVSDSVNESNNPSTAVADIEIAVGNNGVEALAALMAHQLKNATNSKSAIEKQIEAALQHNEIDHLLSDHAPKYQEVRHAKGFNAEQYGKIWEITEKPSPSQASLGGEGKLPLHLPSSFLTPLTQLNQLQRKYDQASEQIYALKEQLYADWYKYMHARYTAVDSRGKYPDADKVMLFIESNSMPELENLMAQTGSINWQDSGNTSIPQAEPLHGNTTANKLYEAWNAFNVLIEQENVKRAQDKLDPLQLSVSPGPRYWKANEPALLINGIQGVDSGADSSSTALACSIYSSAQTVSSTSLATDGTGDVLHHFSGTSSQKLSTQTWNPYLMDWEIDLKNNQLKNSNGVYSSDSFQDNFQLEQFGPNLEYTPSAPDKISVFTGTVMLSGHSTHALKDQITNFLEAYIKKQGLKYIVNPSNKPHNYTFSDFLSASSWNKATQVFDTNTVLSATTIVSKNPVRAVWKCYQQLTGTTTAPDVLSQSLNGFSEACNMRKKVAQLPIKEPLGFGYEQAFTQKVNQLVGRAKSSSPVMAFNFDPIHGGEFDIKRLSLINSFGIAQALPMDTATIISSNSMTDANGKLSLPERFSQSARLNFRYLQPNSNEEMNSHPESSPICGWLMADYLNNFIAVYDAKGKAMGYVNASAQWNPTPWAVNVQSMEDTLIDDALYKVVEQLCSHENFFQNFMTATQNALDNIAPHNAHLFSTKAILMGKPMAIVRTQLNYEVKGLPSLEQSWSALLSDMQASNRELMRYANRNDRDWSNMKFPLRIGEHIQLNDGLLGYWIESETGELSGEFIAPQTQHSSVSDIEIDTYTSTSHQMQWMSLNDVPMRTTMIVDPVGALHATTGILPTKSISIPSEHYLPVLEKLAFWFRISPLLQTASTENTMPLNLPKISGYQWKWWNKKDGFKALSKEPTTPDIHGNYQLKDGWLLLSPESN